MSLIGNCLSVKINKFLCSSCELPIASSLQGTQISLLSVCDQSGFLIFAHGKALACVRALNHILIVSFPTEVIKAELGIHRL